ncbi:MAG: hypothetical protein PWQ64_928 [Desulfomicrobiaceae bacterium]|jgi:cytochrome c5|nr:hypothetical protein [Desulfomicrobiaceae bacterium]MDI3492724.1 hypothetical protein [Desulfomicrobiaceae bacterium]MDK2873164.1 hypothetical protein [Desulfomicrobiaceae bacterium]HCF05927.1 hypothetical protein [Desulfomicrobiaceae bacterium]
MKSLLLIVGGLVLTAGMAVAAGDEALARRVCTSCHSFKRVEARFGQDQAAWEKLVGRMLAKGAAPQISDAERAAVVQWLASQK